MLKHGLLTLQRVAHLRKLGTLLFEFFGLAGSSGTLHGKRDRPACKIAALAPNLAPLLRDQRPLMQDRFVGCGELSALLLVRGSLACDALQQMIQLGALTFGSSELLYSLGMLLPDQRAFTRELIVRDSKFSALLLKHSLLTCDLLTLAQHLGV